MGKIEHIQVAPEDRERLVKLVKDRNTPQKIVWRSQIVLFAGEGIGAVEVATRVGKSVLTVRRWRRRYASKGVDGLLKDATRPPGRKPLTARKIKQVVNQALDRTQPGLPMKKGRCGTMTHDYKRNGTTTLFAALNMLDGTVIGQCMPRHRHREFLRFLKTIDERTLPNLDLHLIVDNYATHKTPAVKRWLKRHSRFHLHFTPTSGSWLNMVERFFAEITRKRIRRGVFKTAGELEQAIMDYLDNHNGHPKPYVWTKTAAEIFSKVARAKQVLESQH